MKSFLITLHRWLGLPLGLLFVVTFGTGFVSAIDELLSRQSQVAFNQHYNYRVTSLAEDAAAVSFISQAHKDISRIQVPTPQTPYYQASSREASWTYAIGDLTQPITVERQENEFFSTVLQLHRNFLLGRDGLFDVEGKYIAAWVGLISLLLSLLGLWIWWPLRKSFKVKDIVPQGVKRKHFYFSHMTSGVIVLVAIIIFALTGAAITYRSVAQALFAVERNQDGSDFQVKNLDRNWHAWLAAAYGEMPEGARLTDIRYPRQPRGRGQTNGKPDADIYEGAKDGLARERENMKSATDNNSGVLENETLTKVNPSTHAGEIEANESKVLIFRFSTSADWFNLTRSEVKIDQMSASMLGARRFEEFPINEKIYLLLVPLHTGKDLPLVYVWLQLIFSLCGTLMVFSGLVSFITKKRRKIRRRSDNTKLVASQA